jgi:hypothetical protein
MNVNLKFSDEDPSHLIWMQERSGQANERQDVRRK